LLTEGHSGKRPRRCTQTGNRQEAPIPVVGHVRLGEANRSIRMADIGAKRLQLRSVCRVLRTTILLNLMQQAGTSAQVTSHSRSLDQRRRPLPFLTAIASAFRCPTSTTSRLPRVTPV
jgi:hypothetical protein